MRFIIARERRRRAVLVFWLVMFIASGILWQQEGSRLTPRISLLEQTESMRGSELIDRRMDPAHSSIRIVCAGTASSVMSQTIGQPTETGQISIDLAGLRDCYGQRWRLTGQQGPQGPQEKRLLDASSPVGRFLLPPEVLDAVKTQQVRGDIAQHLRDAAVEDLWHAERLSVPIAFVVLFVLTGSLAAASLPFAIALWSSIVAVGMMLLFLNRSISMYAANITVMIGMAVGLDYTLLCLQRYREERRKGASLQDGLERTLSTAGRAVALSGIIVVVSFGGMLFVPINVFRDVSIGAIAVVLLNIIALFTVLPILIGAMEGRRITRITGQRQPAIPQGARRYTDHAWSWLSRCVTRRPVICIAFVAALLIPLAAQSLAMQGQISVPRMMVPESVEEADGMNAYAQQELNASLLSVVEVVVGRDGTDQVNAGVEPLLREIGIDNDFAPMVAMEESPDGTLTVVRALVVHPAGSKQASDAIRRLERDLIPVAFADSSASVFVSGPLATYDDVRQAIHHWKGRIMVAIIAISTVLLGVAFRSVTMSLLAVFTTCLSVAAAIGSLVLVVQKGYGAAFLGMETAPAIEQWIPIVVFCIVFGLSMDYHVFMVSRIREQFLSSGDIASSIHTGLRTTGSVICGAALIMAVVFAGFASGSIPMLQQAGLALATAVLIDAFLIRLVLVPACLSLLSRRHPAIGG